MTTALPAGVPVGATRRGWHHPRLPSTRPGLTKCTNRRNATADAPLQPLGVCRGDAWGPCAGGSVEPGLGELYEQQVDRHHPEEQEEEDAGQGVKPNR